MTRAILLLVAFLMLIAPSSAQTPPKKFRIYAITFRGMTDVEKGF